jgi:hypothetical protein
MLETLRHHDKLIGVATGNLEEIGWPKLQAGGLKHYFNFGFFSDYNEQRSEIFRSAVAETRRRLGPRLRSASSATPPLTSPPPKPTAAPSSQLLPASTPSTNYPRSRLTTASPAATTCSSNRGPHVLAAVQAYRGGFFQRFFSDRRIH